MGISKVAEQMAIAVLRGDEAAAVALADMLCEDSRREFIQIAPLKRIECPLDRIRMVLYVDSSSVFVGDHQATEKAVREWLSNGISLVLQGISHMELYEVPAP